MFENVLKPGTQAYYWQRRNPDGYEVLGPTKITKTAVNADGEASYEMGSCSTTIYAYATKPEAYLSLGKFLREQGQRYKERMDYEATMFERAAATHGQEK